MLDILTQNLRKLRHRTELLETFDWDEELVEKALEDTIKTLNEYAGEDHTGLIPHLKSEMDKLGYTEREVKLLLKILSLDSEDMAEM